MILSAVRDERPWRKVLPSLKKERSIDFVIANAENASGGSGLIPKNAEELLSFGIDVITHGGPCLGQDRKFLTFCRRILKISYVRRIFPMAYRGQDGPLPPRPMVYKVGVINLLGRIFMRYNVLCPFLALDSIVAQIKEQTPLIMVDMHAEATSEKVALGHFADGKVSLVFGTHTHIQTADEKILPQGTAYITDLGMSGPV